MAVKEWFETRLPVINFWRKHFSQYPVPGNINFWYLFGSLALLVLVNQAVTGIWLTMSYVPTQDSAFASVEMMMRDVDYGWLLRYMHTTGASALFIVIYLHMYRGIIYGSYQQPRELVWILGMLTLSVVMAEAFMGYLLPWGQMSYWGAQVITSLFGAIPVVGDELMTWIRGDYIVSGVTLGRFFALHVIALPLMLLFLIVLHVTALHTVGSNNPDGTETKLPKGTMGKGYKPQFDFHDDYTRKYDLINSVPFYPYGCVKDLFGISIFLLFFCYILFFSPDGGGYFLESANFEAADPMTTPESIAPVWYFTPFYAMLQAIPNKLLGVVMLGMSVCLLFLLPWIDRCKVRSIRYRSKIHMFNIAQFAVCFIGLGAMGAMSADFSFHTGLVRVFTLGYFMFFVLLFFYSKRERTKPLPEGVTG
ncbi:cytochrome b [Vibrio mangrovi]|nr:Cytochrome b [Vibrio mangrovi]